MNRQQVLVGKVNIESLRVLSDEGDWCEVSFSINDIRTDCFIRKFEGWYCYSYGKFMVGYHQSNWNRCLHPITHQSLYTLMRLYREKSNR